MLSSIGSINNSVFTKTTYASINTLLARSALWLDATDTTTMGTTSSGTGGTISNNTNVAYWKNKGYNSMAGFTWTTGSGLVYNSTTLNSGSYPSLYNTVSKQSTNYSSLVATNFFAVVSYTRGSVYLSYDSIFAGAPLLYGGGNNSGLNSSMTNGVISVNGTVATSNANVTKLQIIEVNSATPTTYTCYFGNWEGYFSEIIIFDFNLSTYNIKLVEGYLAWKYGLQGSLPTNHPYYSSSPGYNSALSQPITTPVSFNGTYQTIGNYINYVFTSNGTITINPTLTSNNGSGITISILLIGGGGGGADGANTGVNSGYQGGAGGAGEFLQINNINITSSTTFTIIVGNGGSNATASSNTNSNGGNTSIYNSGSTISYTAYGGGYGAYGVGGTPYVASAGNNNSGSGGGGAGQTSFGNSGAVPTITNGGFGNSGGNGLAGKYQTNYGGYGGGGGGAGSAGSGITGGSGKTPTNVFYQTTYATGGNGNIGLWNNSNPGTANNGAANTGNGGDGGFYYVTSNGLGSNYRTGGLGGSGICVVSILVSNIS